jgi:hypothetical protein
MMRQHRCTIFRIQYIAGDFKLIEFILFHRNVVKLEIGVEKIRSFQNRKENGNRNNIEQDMQ